MSGNMKLLILKMEENQMISNFLWLKSKYLLEVIQGGNIKWQNRRNIQ